MRDSLRPRVAAIAPSAADAVRYAGGWLFDQVMAGLDVTVVTAAAGQRRPLDILGVRARALDAVVAAPTLGPGLRSIALPTDLYRDDERVRRLVLAAAEAGRIEIRLWGDGWPADFDGSGDPVSHQLSLAARAFKAQALAAAGLRAAPSGAGATEVFRRGELRRLRLAAVSLQNV
jgi:hypothetical protein